MPVESVYGRLEPLLPLVRKPVQYVGGELNAVVKDWDAADVRWALMYPDAYEIGVANQGIQILYEVLNGCDGVLAERTYSVWPDLERLLRERGIVIEGPIRRARKGRRAPSSGLDGQEKTEHQRLLENARKRAVAIVGRIGQLDHAFSSHPIAAITLG